MARSTLEPITTLQKLSLKPIKKLDLEPKKKLDLEPAEPASVSSALQKVESIIPQKPFPQRQIEALDTSIKRKAALGKKALIGDVPFVRKAHTEEQEKVTPATGVEKATFVIPRLVRDLYITSKVAPLRGAKLLGAAGLYGAATAESEEAKEIAKSAGLTAGLFGAISGAAKYGPKAISAVYKKVVPAFIKQRLTQVGQAVGTSLKRIPNIEKLKFARRSEIKTAQIEGEQFARSLEQSLTKQEREVIPFLIEKTGIPKRLNRPDLIAIVKNKEKRQLLQKVAGQLEGRYNSFHKELLDVYGDDVGYIKGYVNRLWNIPKNKEQKVVNWFMTKTGHTKKRLIKTIQDGVNKFGLEPKTLDTAELYRYYNNNVTVALANMRMVKGLKALKSGDGKPMIMRFDKAPKEWGRETVINHPVMNRAMGIKMGDKLLLSKVPVKVHPEIVEEMKTVFGTTNESAISRAVDGINAFAKHSQLSLSLFHHIALTESAIATGSFSPKLMLQTIRMMKKGQKPILDNPLSKEWIKEGLELGAPTDVHRNLVESSLIAAEENLKKNVIGKVGAKVLQPLRVLLQKNNKLLWDYYHPQLKIYAANKLYQDALKMPKYAGLPQQTVKREVAQFVNDTFGGQSWELMVRSPQWQKNMHRFLLSPDWTLSTIRQALSPFGVGARNKATQGLRSELGQNFWKTGGIILYSGINNLNRAFSKFYLGEERDMVDNDPGNETYLFTGFNKDGTKKYLRWGKQFRELPEFFFKDSKFNPLGASIKKISGKLSPIIQLARGQTDPYKYGKLSKALGTRQEVPERLKAAAGFFLPYSTQTQIRRKEIDAISFAFPSSRGMTYYKTIDMFKEAIKIDDKPLVKRIYKAALENELNAEKLYKKAFSDVEYEKTGGYKKANEVYIKLRQLPPAAWKSYIKSLNLDDVTKKRLNKILKDKRETKALLQQLGQ